MSTKMNAEELAGKFHETYERLAPSFGYETRKETRAFDPDSPNGKLMIAVCREIAQPLADERDALRKALELESRCLDGLIRLIEMLTDSPVSLHGHLMDGLGDAQKRLDAYRAILAKYPKP